MRPMKFRLTAMAGAACLALSGCRSVPPPTPLDQLTAEQTAGHEVFQARCASCHYERVNKGKNGPSLRGLFKHPYLPSGAPANDERVSATILQGHGLMPAQPGFDPESLQALLAYLHTV